MDDEFSPLLDEVDGDNVLGDDRPSGLHPSLGVSDAVDTIFPLHADHTEELDTDENMNSEWFKDERVIQSDHDHDHDQMRLIHRWRFGSPISKRERFQGFPTHSRAKKPRYKASVPPDGGADNATLRPATEDRSPAERLRGRTASRLKRQGKANVPVKVPPSALEDQSSFVPTARDADDKPCNCSKSQCLKMYCECFAAGKMCDDACRCTNCKNTDSDLPGIRAARKSALERNPHAFVPKVSTDGAMLVNRMKGTVRGCSCKKSGCLKGYCECYQAKVACSYLCVCQGCQNNAEIQALRPSNAMRSGAVPQAT